MGYNIINFLYNALQNKIIIFFTTAAIFLPNNIFTLFPPNKLSGTCHFSLEFHLKTFNCKLYESNICKQVDNKYIIPNPNPHKAQMSLSDFMILSKIGQGSYSSVHKVKRMSDNKLYALKQVKIASLKDKQKQNALNEVRILASISSPNIIGYKEAFFDTKTNTLCIVMEFADGGDLEKVIEKRKRSLSWVPEQEIWKMAKEVLSGLSVLHDMNIIHRDLKSANIFISEGVYKLGDLNVSKLLKASLAYTQTGTPYYASPEVWNDKPYELKSDIWSLGCIIYQYCSLKPPFTANSMDGLFKKVMRGIYPRIPGSYSQKMEKFIAKCLQLDPKNRPNCKQLLAMIPKKEQQAAVQEKYGSQTNISLLNTIKVPRNLNSLINDLPKSNYQKDPQANNPKQNIRKKFGYLSQQRLKQIVRQKNPQVSQIKKNSLKRITPEITNSQRSTPNYQTNTNQNQLQNSLLNQPIIPSINPKRVQKLQPLPKIKIHSQPTDANNNSLGLRMDRKNNYQYNRPAWWG